MREIKFRGKRVPSGEWIYGDLVHGTRTWDRRLAKVAIQKSGYFPEGVDIKTVGQYTGIKDKNGVDIFKDDILEVTDEMNTFNEKCVVKWFEDGAYWNVTNLEEGLGDLGFNYYIKVIGNIHDNKKLLEEVKINNE